MLCARTRWRATGMQESPGNVQSCVAELKRQMHGLNSLIERALRLGTDAERLPRVFQRQRHAVEAAIQVPQVLQ